MNILLDAVFRSAFTVGSLDVKDVMSNFDFHSFQEGLSNNTFTSQFCLAPSFGKLRGTDVALLDDKLKFAISATTRALSNIEGPISWAKLLSVLMQNPLLEPMDSMVERSEKFVRDYGSSIFRFDGSPDPTVVQEVDVWFKNLIGDMDIIQSTGIDIDFLGKIVGSTGAAVNSFGEFFAKEKLSETTAVDIGVLRYPDLDNPYFKVYHIKLMVWADSRRFLIVQSDKNGIKGEFAVRRFRPRDSVIREIRQELRTRAVREVELYYSTIFNERN